jgi:hypothetical protein
MVWRKKKVELSCFLKSSVEIVRVSVHANTFTYYWKFSGHPKFNPF